MSKIGDMMVMSKQIRRVAIIGAGPSGISALKYLLAENYFDMIDVFERRSSFGGVWNHCPGSLKAAFSCPVPQLSPDLPCEEPVWHSAGDSGKRLEPVYVSPLYSTLDANLPKELMAYGEKQFPGHVQDLPKHSSVKEYLEEYGQDVKEFIKFETQVLDVRMSSNETDTWAVKFKSLRSGIYRSESYDAIVVASGHFDVPYLPDIPGIATWNSKFPGIISHSKFFDSPAPFRDKKVIVIGSSASGLDIGNQINQVSKGKVLASQRTDLYLSPAVADKLYFPEIAEFLSPLSHDRAVRFADGRVEDKIDAIVFCTGYLYSFPFLSSLNPPVITDGRRVLNTYQHLFYIHNPTLVFPVLPQRIIPFPLSENQAAVFARVWSGRLSLPSTAEMEAWEASTIARKGVGTGFHLLPFPLDADYMNMLYDWAARAQTREGLVNSGTGKSCNFWGPKEKWMRQMSAEIRKAFSQKGDERSSIKSLTELGYDFEKWKNEQQHYP